MCLQAKRWTTSGERMDSTPGLCSAIWSESSWISQSKWKETWSSFHLQTNGEICSFHYKSLIIPKGVMPWKIFWWEKIPLCYFYKGNHVCLALAICLFVCCLFLVSQLVNFYFYLTIKVRREGYPRLEIIRYIINRCCHSVLVLIIFKIPNRFITCLSHMAMYD